MVRLHAIVGEGDVPASLRLLSVGSLRLAVADVAERPAATQPALREHDRIVRELLRRFDAVLPARFGQIFPDEGVLVGELRAREPALLAALGRVRGCRQMTVRLLGGAQADDRSGGAAFLRSRASLPGQRELRSAAGPLVRDERWRRGPEPAIGSVYHLVAQEDVGPYRERVAATELPPGIRLVCAGPFAPYAFAGTEAP